MAEDSVRRKIIKVLEEHGELSLSEIHEILGINEETITARVAEYRLAKMAKEGVVEKKKSGNKVTYKLLPLPEKNEQEKQELSTDQQVQYEKRITILETKLHDLTRKYKASHKENQLHEEMMDALRVYAPKLIAPEPIPLHSERTHEIEEYAVLLLSDLHLWDEVLLEHTGGLSEYSFDIACEYLQSLVMSIVEILRVNHTKTKFPALYIYMLGDMLSGLIHKLMDHAPATIIQAKLEAGLLIACLVRDLSRYFPKVICNCVVGNHPRLFAEKSYKWRVEENFDWDLYCQVAISLMNFKNIEFHIPRSFWMLQRIYDWEFLLLHGDDIRSWNQIPWYGINRALANFRELLDANRLHFDYATLAHFHNTATLDRCHGELFINGSGIGTTDYSLGKLFTGNIPKQQFFGVHTRKGVSWRYPIIMERLPDGVENAYKLDRTREVYEQIIETMRS